MKPLIIVESPTKAKKIQSMLNDGTVVLASMGHVLDLPKSEMGVAAPDYRPKYVDVKGGAAIARIRKASMSCSEIILATDPDREGEAISAHLAMLLKLRNPKRVRFNEVTAKAIRDALAKPSTIDTHLVEAQEARRCLDRLVGYGVSPKLSDVTGQRGLSAGRVQSPALRLIVEREEQIKAFTSTKYYVVALTFNTAGVAWSATWDPSFFLEEGQTHCTDRTLAEDIALTTPVRVTHTETKRVARRPSPPLITSTMQQLANTSLGMGSGTTMQAAQALFDAGHITYHRTDFPNLSQEGTEKIWAWLKANSLGDTVPAKPNQWKAKEGAQEAHEAIRPTHVEHEHLADMDENAQRLYALIRARAIMSQMKPAALDATVITLAGRSPAGKDAHFVARGAVVIDPGWMKFLTRNAGAADDGAGDDDDAPLAQLPAVTKGSSLTPLAGVCEEKKTKAPAAYTEASLIAQLESLGIGRPATYASIISNIVGRDYVKITKRKFVATPLGYLVIVALRGNFQFMEYEFTRQVEAALDKLAAGEIKYVQLMASMDMVVRAEIERMQAPAPHLIPQELRGKLHSLPTETYPCPQCGEGKLHRRPGAKKGFFWGCDRYNRDAPEEGCRHTQPDVDGRPGVKEAEQTFPCTTCGKGKLHRRKGQSGFFWACDQYNRTNPDAGCRHTQPDVDGKPGQRANAAA